MNGTEKILDKLTSTKRGNIEDIKFAPGMSSFVSQDEFCKEVDSALRQLEAGTAKRIKNIDGDFNPRTVAQFVA